MSKKRLLQVPNLLKLYLKTKHGRRYFTLTAIALSLFFL